MCTQERDLVAELRRNADCMVEEGFTLTAPILRRAADEITALRGALRRLYSEVRPEEVSMSTCWICGGEGVPIGTQGHLELYRCRDCGRAEWWLPRHGY